MSPNVDFHHHAPTASYVERLTAIGVQAQPGLDFPSWHPDDSIRIMDELGIDLSVLSVGSPGFYFGDQGFTDALCRDTNDELTQIVGARPERFAALVCLPLPSVGSALDELDRVWSRPQFAGVTLLTNYDGHYLGHPVFEPLLAELDRRRAVVHVHPKLPATWPEGELPLPPSVLEYLFDTTRTITSLVLARVTERFPGIRWIFSHCGGAMPVAARRIALAEPSFAPERVPAAGFVGTLDRFHYDTALSTTAADLGAVRTIVSDAQLLFGSDFPFSPVSAVRRAFADLSGYVDADLLQRIRSQNAVPLLDKLPQATT